METLGSWFMILGIASFLIHENNFAVNEIKIQKRAGGLQKCLKDCINPFKK